MSDSKARWGDYNADGYVDLLNGDTLYRNNGPDGGFTPLSAGIVVGGPVQDCDAVCGFWADYDNDHLLDLYDNGDNVVYRNLSTSMTTAFVPIILPPVANMGHSLASSWADFDNNGYVDLYLGGWETSIYQSDAILMNDNGSFTRT